MIHGTERSIGLSEQGGGDVVGDFRMDEQRVDESAVDENLVSGT